ncbi:MAG TPA: S-layer homology domain-containing protein [Thermoanaerobaculia bacterium]|nr:S-layer homology domain-containing protein [Thermoanaerobaculia bacterium]
MKIGLVRVPGLCSSLVLAVATGAGSLLGLCGPFTDVAADVFCPFVLEIFYLGITTGTTATTYDPTANVSRLQMAAFLSRTVDGLLRRGSRRAALDQYWNSKNASVLGLTTVGSSPGLPASDGQDIWVPGFTGQTTRVRASDGKLLETWNGANQGYGALVAMGKVFISGQTVPGFVYRIDPSQPAGTVTTVASFLGDNPQGITFDGSRIWTANFGVINTGSVSIITPAASFPWSVTTVTTGFTECAGAIFDGSNVWVTDSGPQALRKLDANGAILQTVTLEPAPKFPAFDGANIWVPALNNGRVWVVRASTGVVLATLSGNGLFEPYQAAFDGQRILVTNGTDDTVCVWKAADLTPLGVFETGAASGPFGACSDGINFWITLSGPDKLARF